jgi:hypothetical protein
LFGIDLSFCGERWTIDEKNAKEFTRKYAGITRVFREFQQAGLSYSDYRRKLDHQKAAVLSAENERKRPSLVNKPLVIILAILLFGLYAVVMATLTPAKPRSPDFKNGYEMGLSVGGMAYLNHVEAKGGELDFAARSAADSFPGVVVRQDFMSGYKSGYYDGFLREQSR